MGKVIEFQARGTGKTEGGGRFVTCAQCGERHPIVRLADGTERCMSGFSDDGRWFCRNRGCRAAYLGLDLRRR